MLWPYLYWPTRFGSEQIDKFIRIYRGARWKQRRWWTTGDFLFIRVIINVNSVLGSHIDLCPEMSDDISYFGKACIDLDIGSSCISHTK